MSVEVRDAEIENMLKQLAGRRNVSEADVLRAAIRHEWERELDAERMRDKIKAFQERVRVLSPPSERLTIDKAFRDSLYEDD